MIRLNETNPRLDRRNTFVDESHSGHVANYLVHDLVVPARRRETEGSPLFPRCSGRSPIDSSPRSGSGFSFESSLRGGALRSALGKSSSRALELPFYDSAFIEACTFQSGPRHNRSAYAPRHHGEGASNRREYHPNQPYPRGSGGRGGGGRFPFWKYASIVLQSAYLRHPRVDITWLQGRERGLKQWRGRKRKRRRFLPYDLFHGLSYFDYVTQ